MTTVSFLAVTTIDPITKGPFRRMAVNLNSTAILTRFTSLSARNFEISKLARGTAPNFRLVNLVLGLRPSRPVVIIHLTSLANQSRTDKKF